MSKASFRNAPVSALIYELLYDAYDLISEQRLELEFLADEKERPLGVFWHRHVGRWEWSAYLLEVAGAIVRVYDPETTTQAEDAVTGRCTTPYFTPVMTLEECQATDFSAFETFDNYCVAMFTFENPGERDDCLSCTSPLFFEAVAAKDDIFEIDEFDQVTFNEYRFKEKVMTRWDEMQIRQFKAAVTFH